MCSAASSGAGASVPLLQPLPPERRHPQDAMGLPVECQTPFECQNGRIWRRDERGSNPRSRDRDCPHVGSIMIADVPMRRTSSRMRLRRASASVANVCRRWYGPFLQDPGRAECGILLAASRKLSRPTSPRMVVKVKRDDFSVESDPGVAVFLREARATIARSGVSIVRVTVPGCWDSRRSGCIARRKSRPCSSPRVRH